MKITLLQLGLTLLVGFATSSCAPERFSPFGEETNFPVEAIHSNSLTKILSQPQQQGTSQDIHILLIADSHANYEGLESVVKKMNPLSADFVVHLGDMTELGLAIEYHASLEFLTKINKPLFTVIGNHDTIGSGKNIYRRHFGEYNYFFDYKNFRFVFFNNNYLDFYDTGIDIHWLKSTIEQSDKPVILFQHVDPFNADYFKGSTAEQLNVIYKNSNLKAIFHGHLHRYVTSSYNHVLVQQIDRTENISFAEVMINQHKIDLTLNQGEKSEKFYFNLESL